MLQTQTCVQTNYHTRRVGTKKLLDALWLEHSSCESMVGSVAMPRQLGTSSRPLRKVDPEFFELHPSDVAARPDMAPRLLFMRPRAFLCHVLVTLVGVMVLGGADTHVPWPPHCTYGLRVPASCVLYVPEAQGSLLALYAVRGTRYAYQSLACCGTTGGGRRLRLDLRERHQPPGHRRRRHPSGRARRAAAAAVWVGRRAALAAHALAARLDDRLPAGASRVRRYRGQSHRGVP